MYTFFSVFLPGLALILFLYPLLPLLSEIYPLLLEGYSESALENVVPVVGLVMFVTLGLFVGFVVHALGAQLEAALSGMSLPVVGEEFGMGKPHRVLFAEMVRDELGDVSRGLVDPFLFVAANTFPYIDLPTFEPTDDDAGDREIEIDADAAESLYILVRANVHMSRTGRSRTFQAVFATCRTMSAVFLLLMIAYLSYASLAIHQGQLYFASEMFGQEAIEVMRGDEFSAVRVFVSAAILGPLLMYGFARAAYRLKRHYLEYLVGDFLLLQSDVTDNVYAGEEPVNRPRYWQSVLSRENRRR